MRRTLRLWTCPLCGIDSITYDKPSGWLIAEPFNRVVACTACRRDLERRDALQKQGLDT